MEWDEDEDDEVDWIYHDELCICIYRDEKLSKEGTQKKRTLRRLF